jgi:peptidoglycan/xylan/chitin deacetylase (PgdA/CDA1 family)
MPEEQRCLSRDGEVAVMGDRGPSSGIRSMPSRRLPPLLGGPRTLFLAYHAVDPDWKHPLSVPPARFAEQLARLAARGYRGTTFASAVLGDHDDRVVSVSFDDAYVSVERHALPVLEELGWPATVFAPTESIDTGEHMWWLGEDARRHPEQTAQLSWDALAALSSRGWEIGSHGRTHRLLSRLGDDDLEEELEGSKRDVETHLGSCRSVSYPWGEVDDRVVEAARRVGYETGSGLAGRFTIADPLRAPRLAIAGTDADWRVAMKTSAIPWMLRHTHLWTLLERARGLHIKRDEYPRSILASVLSWLEWFGR